MDIVHPLVSATSFKAKLSEGKKLHKILIAQSAGTARQQMGLFGWDPFSDLSKGIGQLIDGLADVLGEVLDNIVQTVGQIVQAVFDVIAGIMTLDWDRVVEGLGATVRGISNIAAQLNPMRIGHDVLTSVEWTKHSFNELDKFTGGMITNAVNVSDLPMRAARGDAISKAELLNTAIFGLQVAAIVVGGPVAAGAMVGNMFGRELCKNVGNKEAVEACKVGVQIVAVASAQYASSVYDVSWGGSMKDMLTGGSKEVIYDSAGQVVSSGATDTLVQVQQNNLNALFLEQGNLTFYDYIKTGTVELLNQRVVEEATKEAIKQCQDGDWLGDRECAIIGQIASNYINAPPSKDWPTFLAEEAARLGVGLLVEQWFPEGSAEREAIKYQLEYVTIPGQRVIIGKQESNLGVFAMLAAGAGIMLMLG